MRFYYISAKDLSRADTTIIRTLRRRESILRPAIRPAGEVQHGVFLLQTEPELLLGVLLHDYGGVVAEVERVGLAVGHPGLAHYEDVVAEAEGVRVHCDGAEVDVGVVAGGLRGGGAVEVPFGEVGDLAGLAGEGLS